MASEWYYLDRSGQQMGPVSATQLKALAAAGTVGPETLVVGLDMPKPVKAKNIKGLFQDVLQSGDDGQAFPMVVRTDGVPAAALPVLPARAAPPVPAEPAPRPDRPGYSPSTLAPAGLVNKTDRNAFTDEAHRILNANSEQTAWQGHPSPLLLLRPALKWCFTTIFFEVALSILCLSVSFALAPNRRPLLVLVALILPLTIGVVFGGLHLGLLALRLRNTTFRLTGQRLEITAGLLSAHKRFFQVIDLGNTEIIYPFPLRFLGIATLIIHCNRKILLLEGIGDADLVSDLIASSTASGAMGQRWDKDRAY